MNEIEKNNLDKLMAENQEMRHQIAKIAHNAKVVLNRVYKLELLLDEIPEAYWKAGTKGIRDILNQRPTAWQVAGSESHQAETFNNQWNPEPKVF